MNIPPSNSEYEVRVLSVVVAPVGEPIFSERATIVSMEDDAGGEYVKVRQVTMDTEDRHAICLSASEWPMIRDCIDAMIGQCRE